MYIVEPPKNGSMLILINKSLPFKARSLFQVVNNANDDDGPANVKREAVHLYTGKSFKFVEKMNWMYNLTYHDGTYEYDVAAVNKEDIAQYEQALKNKSLLVDHRIK